MSTSFHSSAFQESKTWTYPKASSRIHIRRDTSTGCLRNCAVTNAESRTLTLRYPKTLLHKEGELQTWLPPGDDGRMSPTMAHWKRQSTVSSLLDHRVRPGLEPKSKDVEELALEEYMPTGLELAALWPERPLPAQKGGPDGYFGSN
ncbi:hypothetical protein E5288_WYG022673 [Bos mutus]|uniref:Uncharacterized protein n=1 Tax=Bos mutus TaxID=72004 RepID=A0A6B0R348_9CETA|nr:hypothetical protein [Bos mutus]